VKTIKKIILITLLLGMVGSALADTDWYNTSGNRRWDDAANWDNGVPTIADKAGIRHSIPDGPIIDSSTTAVANVVVCGDWSQTGIFDITGGSLTTNSWIILGYGSSTEGTFNVDGGTTTVGGHLTVARAGEGHMNMTDGTVTVNDAFRIASDGGTGDVQLDDGTITCDSFSMAAGATMDITDGTPYVFSSHNRKTVLRHFSWMKEYGTDGAFLQRFISGTSPGTTRNHKDQVMLYCQEGANLHKRAWAMMYDLSSGFTTTEIRDQIINDWMHLVDTYGISKDPTDAAYLHHNGKPVVALWGLGFEEDGAPRGYEGEGTRDAIDFIKNDPVYGGCTIMIGTDNEWRQRMSSPTHPYFDEIVEMADIISPWAVGRYGSTNPSSFDDFVANKTIPDQVWCNAAGKDYLPVIFPGFSWYNLKHDDEGYTAVFDSRPRLGGTFLWRQLYKNINDAGCTMMYQAMFDEVDEGTAIFKISNSPPVSEEPTSYSNPFLPIGNAQHAPYDISDADLPSDHYLWLLGEGVRMLKGQRDLTPTMPTRGTGLIEGTFVHWKLDETTGAVAEDDSANDYDGTLVNMDDSDWVPGLTGNALDLDGVNDHVLVDDICTAIAGRDLTVSAWVKAPALNPNMQFMIAINSSSGNNKLMFGTRASTATLSFVDSEPVWRDTTATVIDNTWHHIAYVLDDSADTITVYVDGSQVLSFTSTVSISNTDLFSLGQEYDAGLTTGDFYSGQLDDVRVYDRALSVTDILGLFDPSTPLAHWKLDETAGAIAQDSSSGIYDGTLVNMDDSDWLPGHTGNALDFDGVNDYVTVDGICSAMAGSDITVSAWVKAPAVNPVNQFIISINTSNGDDNKLLMGTPAGTATLSLGDTSWHHTTATVIDNTWHHIAYVLEDSPDTITVYVDGTEAISFASTVSIAADDVFSLAQEYDPGMTPGDFYDGLLDDVRVYGYALSETEIAALAQ